ncbi:HupE/UreJ family protein [bacterium]|nr:HupE/UreJ family protein [bacterium]
MAHNQTYAVAQIDVAEDRTVRIALSFHVAAFLMGEAQGHLGAEARADWADATDADLADIVAAGSAYLREHLEVYSDGDPAPIEAVAFPDLTTLRADGLVPEAEARPSAPVTIQARLGPGASTFAFAAPPEFAETLMSVEDWRGARIAQSLSSGQRSHPFVLGREAGRGEVLVAVPAWAAAAAQFGWLGFVHILPRGLDHILFVLALFLLAPSWRPLAFQVTAFTLAHSVTLALGVLGIVEAPALIVEPLIALSIVAMALDNVRGGRLQPWRPAVVFGFGLLHGLGFANVLKGLGLPRGEEAAALVSFNVGVELGQLSVLALAFLAVGWFIRREWFRARIAVPASLAIAGIGAWWTIERVAANL